MSYMHVGPTATFTVKAATTITEGQALKLATDGTVEPTAAAGDYCIGFAMDAGTAGDAIRVWLSNGGGICKALVDGTTDVAIGDKLSLSATAGTMVKQSSTNDSWGVALEAHTENAARIIAIAPQFFDMSA